jgi:hypothetical protein
MLRSYWPTGLTDLVIKAAFHADFDVARIAWRTWQNECDFDHTAWSDIRVASLAYQRWGCDDGANTLKPRLSGLRRYIWSAISMRLAGAIPLLREFQNNGVKFMLIKGSVLLARSPRSAADRFMTDIDVLADHASWTKALYVARQDGWSTGPRASYDDAVHRIRQFSHAVALRRDQNGSVDLHYFSLKHNKQLAADAELWKRATSGRLNDVVVLLPHPSDQLAITFGHCFLHAAMPSRDWIYDSKAAISSPDFDWNLFSNVVMQRELAVPAVAALSYVADQLGWDIPSEILGPLARSVREPFVTELATLHQSYRAKKPADLNAIYRAECIRSRKSFHRSSNLAEPNGPSVTDASFRCLKPGGKIYLPMPVAGPGQYIHYSLELEAIGFTPGSSVRASLRCFEGMPLEFGRLTISRRRTRYKLKGRIDGALRTAREIDQIWFTLSKKAPPGASLRGVFKASTGRETWARQMLGRLFP